MTPEAADWVYEVVLTQTYRRAVGAEGRGNEDLQLGPAAVRTCHCQWGPCGHCSAGRVDRCAHRTIPDWPRPSPATHIVTRAGGARTDVWLSGTPCRWRCPGPPGGEQAQLFSAARRPPRLDRGPQPGGRTVADENQLSLFDLTGGVR